MKKLIPSTKELFKGMAERKRGKTQPPVPVERDHLFADLRMFLSQTATAIGSHLEYERRIASGVPNDSGLVLRFRIEDYVEELFEFLDRKGLATFDENFLVRATIEVLVPPSYVRAALSIQHRRELFVGLMRKTAERRSVPFPKLTKTFYDQLAGAPEVNGVPTKQVLELYDEVIKELSRGEASQLPERPLDATALLARALAACGAKNEGSLKRILNAKPFIEFLFRLVVASLVLALALSYAAWVSEFFLGQFDVVFDPVVWSVAAGLVYLFVISGSWRMARFLSMRRRSLIRVSNLLAEAFDLSYKEMDDVLQEAYGTNLGHLKRALLPRRGR